MLYTQTVVNVVLLGLLEKEIEQKNQEEMKT